MKRQPSLSVRLKRGDRLVGTLGDGGVRTWRLARSGIDVDAATARTLMRTRFLGGRLHPAGDCLPGFDPGCSQTWIWQATPPRIRQPAGAARPDPAGAVHG